MDWSILLLRFACFNDDMLQNCHIYYRLHGSKGTIALFSVMIQKEYFSIITFGSLIGWIGLSLRNAITILLNFRRLIDCLLLRMFQFYRYWRSTYMYNTNYIANHRDCSINYRSVFVMRSNWTFA